MKTAKMYRLQETYKKDIEEILSDVFASGKTADQIALELGISRPCLYDWLEKLELQIEHTHTRSLSSRRELVSA